jgi:hypothetical protein
MQEPSLSDLIDRLNALPASDRMFNPYAPPDDPAAAIRRANLARYLEAIQERQPRLALIFEAPGYRGCALTGIPVTSERIMLRGIEKWGLFGAGYHPTSGQAGGVAEITATILWETLIAHLAQPPLIWNSLPLHPHQRGQRRSNRTPTTDEIRMGQPFIEAVLALYPIKTVAAVGRKAQLALGELGIEAAPLRHPSRGGKAKFISGLLEIRDQAGHDRV